MPPIDGPINLINVISHIDLFHQLISESRIVISNSLFTSSNQLEAMYGKQVIYSKNTEESLDECRRVQTNVDESQTNVDECRRVKTSN